ncbi:hypothetical protein MAA_11249 [Metarhizium robertsii ARSEF 23]|uniref:Complex III subunit 9 n=1 Tax=Metarhizium robertsii (strain ARSEF 23 / ATCC MYA-3075) TaxID=655844 RepID=A0A0B2XH06_METRA|nr:uncharacterized protein MAA_11249 [Metarhizium robertsii ARSEF 23]KHO11171.1 hypothetical protein MAA_11249 [Metarhizium robertsii ARSEF 23]
MVSFRIDRAPFCRHSQLIAHPTVSRQLVLQASPSIEAERPLPRPGEANTTCCSALFRKNYAMLAAVFTAGFAFEVYGPHPDKWRTGIRQLLTSHCSGFNNGVNKWWDNHNRGRQWKDIRSKYVEETGEDDE